MSMGSHHMLFPDEKMCCCACMALRPLLEVVDLAASFCFRPCRHKFSLPVVVNVSELRACVCMCAPQAAAGGCGPHGGERELLLSFWASLALYAACLTLQHTVTVCMCAPQATARGCGPCDRLAGGQDIQPACRHECVSQKHICVNTFVLLCIPQAAAGGCGPRHRLAGGHQWEQRHVQSWLQL